MTSRLKIFCGRVPVYIKLSDAISPMYGAANVLDCSSVFFVPWLMIKVSASKPSHCVTPLGLTMLAFSTKYTACAMSARIVAEADAHGLATASV